MHMLVLNTTVCSASNKLVYQTKVNCKLDHIFLGFSKSVCSYHSSIHWLSWQTGLLFCYT